MRLFLFITLFFLTQAAHADTPKIALLDMQKALQTVDAGKKAKAQLDQEMAAAVKQLETEEASLRKAGEEFKQQSSVMNAQAKSKKQAELQERVMKYQEMRSKSDMTLAKRQKELADPIVGKLRSLIADIAKDKGYTLILEKNENTVLFSRDADDLTQEAINRFNQANKVATASANLSGALASSFK